MKKQFQKITAVLIALIMAVSVCVPAFAETSEPFDENIQPAEDEVIATLSLCSCVYVWPISGHTWIYVHNNSDKPIQVGYYEVPAGEGVSIGAFSFSVIDGWGLYYNIEAYKENTKGRINRVRSISEDMTASDLETLNAKLKSYPNYWGIIGNCATFAFSMWNAVTGDAYFSLLIPAISDFMIMVGGGKRGVLEMYCPSRERVFRQRGSGDNGYLEGVSDYTVS